MNFLTSFITVCLKEIIVRYKNMNLIKGTFINSQLSRFLVGPAKDKAFQDWQGGLEQLCKGDVEWTEWMYCYVCNSTLTAERSYKLVNNST